MLAIGSHPSSPPQSSPPCRRPSARISSCSSPPSGLSRSSAAIRRKLRPCGGRSRARRSRAGRASRKVSRRLEAAPEGAWRRSIIPGHYRVALAVNSRDELPPDPVTFERTTERGPQSVWAAIQSPPQLPVIADGLFQHYTRPAPRRRKTRVLSRHPAAEHHAARSARCRSSSSWRSTATTSRAATRTTTAPTCRSPPIRRSRSTRVGRRESRNREMRHRRKRAD